MQRTDKETSGQTFFITPSAVRNLLLEHRKTFARVAIESSEHKGRFIARAEKRRIGTLLVVAGPTSAGKSTLIKRMMEGQLPALISELNLGELSKWDRTTTGGISKLSEAAIENLIFEYDINHPYFKSAQTYDRHEPLGLLSCAQRIVFLTLWTPPERLRAQLDECEILPKTKRGVFKGNARHRKVRAQYDDPRIITRYYRNWFEYCRRQKGRQVIVSAENGGLKFHTLQEWESFQQSSESRLVPHPISHPSGSN